MASRECARVAYLPLLSVMVLPRWGRAQVHSRPCSLGAQQAIVWHTSAPREAIVTPVVIRQRLAIGCGSAVPATGMCVVAARPSLVQGPTPALGGALKAPNRRDVPLTKSRSANGAGMLESCKCCAGTAPVDAAKWAVDAVQRLAYLDLQIGFELPTLRRCGNQFQIVLRRVWMSKRCLCLAWPCCRHLAAHRGGWSNRLGTLTGGLDREATDGGKPAGRSILAG